MEGKLKTQGNKRSEKVNESIPQAIPEDMFELGGSMGMQGAMQQSILGGPYDSMPTNDNIMLPNPNMAPMMMPDQEYVPQIDLNLDHSFSWEMIGLGLEEPMPTQEAVDELYGFTPPTSGYANRTKEQNFISKKYIHLYR